MRASEGGVNKGILCMCVYVCVSSHLLLYWEPKSSFYWQSGSILLGPRSGLRLEVRVGARVCLCVCM